MAFVTCNQKRLTSKKSPLMLKDYLIDDLSSCSSNGFKSFPRRQQYCCTSTVRFLLEIDLKNSTTKRGDQIQRRSSSVSKRASEKIINAVELLPFTSDKSKSVNKARKTLFLPRSFSRKVLKRSFWRKSDSGNEKDEEEFKEIKRWKLFREYLEEKDQPSDLINTEDQQQSNAVSVILDQVSVSTSDNNSDNKSNSNGNSCVEEGEFTKDNNNLPSGNSEVLSENNVVESNKDEKQVSKSVGVTVGNHIESPTTTKEWANEEEKQQFSPVSVLDCPFEDEEEEEDIVSSPFSYRLACMEGSKKKLMQKIKRFENLADQLKPVDLEKRIALSDLEDEQDDDDEDEKEILESPNKPHFSMSIYNNDTFDIHDNGDETHERPRQLLKVVDSRLPFSMLEFKAEILVSDFLIENLKEMNSVEYSIGKQMEMEEDLVMRIESWVDGGELIMKDGRKIYIEEMEKKGEWRNLDEENNEVVLELENGIFTCLLEEEMLLDFF